MFHMPILLNFTSPIIPKGTVSGEFKIRHHLQSHSGSCCLSVSKWSWGISMALFLKSTHLASEYCFGTGHRLFEVIELWTISTESSESVSVGAESVMAESVMLDSAPMLSSSDPPVPSSEQRARLATWAWLWDGRDLFLRLMRPSVQTTGTQKLPASRANAKCQCK